MPIPAGTKRATIPGWSDPHKHDFAVGDADNVAWRLDGIADIDLDRLSAIRMAGYLLPATGAASGRPATGAPSHWFYDCPTAVYKKFDAGGTILEIRTGPGHYTLVPPSLMPAARGLPEEQARWYREEPPAAVGTAYLERRVALLASAVLLAEGLGLHGFGHEARLDVIGFLLRLGLSEEEAIAIGLAVSAETENIETDDVAVVVRSTAARLVTEGRKVRGGTALLRRLGEAGPGIVKAIRGWLGLDIQETAWPNGFAPLTEIGDAEYFAKRYAGNVRWDWARGRWLVWEGHTWITRSDGENTRLAIASCRSRQEEAVRLNTDEARRAALKWALAGESRARLENTVALAKTVRPVSDDGLAWDLDHWLVGASNGVIDLRTGLLCEGDPEDRITMQVGAPYDPKAVCPLWDATIEAIFDGDQELIAYFDRMVGYSLTGDCREEALIVCWGDGANGKGTLMNTLAKAFGDYADDVPFTMFELAARSGIPNDVAKIDRKRFVTSSETGETARLNEARVKALTGRDPITARFLHKEFFTFQPVAKFWLASNHKPIVRDDSPGFWRRIQLLPFRQSFLGREDFTLKDRLLGELPGILARAVRGSLEWQRIGLKPPTKVLAATGEWRGESDLLAPFIEDECIIVPEAKIRIGELYRMYTTWCQRRGEEKLRISQIAFGRKMREKFTVSGSQSKGFKFEGIGLRASQSDANAEM